MDEPIPEKLFVVTERVSDSASVERVWSAHSERAGEFFSIAASTCEMVVSRVQGQTFVTVRGPETSMTTCPCPPEGEWLGIRFKVGTFFPAFSPAALTDRRDVMLPDASARSFWLDGSTWEHPSFENADTFVARLLAKGILARDRSVESIVRGDADPNALSARSAQRRFLRATGITHATVRTIERARYAAYLLRERTSIADVVHLAGYFDQPHLTRSLKRLIGLTPTDIARGTRQLSFLYKTLPPPRMTFSA